MISLPNGCSCSELQVFPKNWKTAKADVKLVWYIHYRFYDPSIPAEPGKRRGKSKLLKGMNQLSTLKSRQDATRALIENEMELLMKHRYNPYTSRIVSDSQLAEEENFVTPRTPFLKALEKISETLKKSSSTMRDIRTTLRGISQAAMELDLTKIEIQSISQKHIKAVLNQCEKTNPKWSANRFNSYRSYLMILFNELVEIEATQNNPINAIKKQKSVRRIRERINDQQRKLISNHLKAKHPDFWRFMQIFFHSGARESELMLVRRRDVDFESYRYKMVIKKGHNYREVWRTIKDVAMPFWKEIVELANENEYLFSKGLLPGLIPINPNQICRRWNRLVKKPLGVTADFYSLKHLNLDETAAILSAAEAQKMAAHATLEVTMNHYLGGENERIHQRLRSVKNAF